MSQQPETLTPVNEGAAYRAVVRLTAKNASVVLAEVGESCERVPESSLPWLIEQGLIVPAVAAGKA